MHTQLIDLDVVNNFILRRSSIIEASAGTGKTFNITYMVLRLLLGPTHLSKNLPLEDASALNAPLNIENILVVTFTKSATAELRGRIRDKIRNVRIIFEKLSDRAIQESFLPEDLAETQLVALIKSYLIDDDAALMSKALAHLDNRDYLSEYGQLACKRNARLLLKAERNIDTASIRTIHSFCNSVINRIYAFEAGEAFSTELCNDISPQYHESCLQIFRSLFYKNPESALLLKLVGTPRESKFTQIIQALTKARLLSQDKLQPPLINIHGYAVNLGTKLKLDLKEELLNKLRDKRLSLEKKLTYLLVHIKSSMAKYQAQAETLALSLKDYSDIFSANKQEICLKGESFKLNKEAYEGIVKLYKALGESTQAEALYQSALVNLPSKSRLHHLQKPFLNQRSKNKDAEFAAPFENFKALVQNLSSTLSLAFEGDPSYGDLLNTLIALMIIDKTEEICDQNHVMSNDTVLFKLAVALRQGTEGKNLAKAIRKRYRVALIDEFQDTDPIQFDIFHNIYLSSECVKENAHNPALGSYCYIIGDPKQSIYAFRNADINSYIKAKKRIQEIAAPQSAVYSLKYNFRSAPEVVSGVNALFTTKINADNIHPFGADSEAVNYVEAIGVRGKKAFFFDDDKDFKCSNFIRCLSNGGKDKLNQLQAQSCALDIKHCLEHGVLVSDPSVKDTLGESKFEPNVKADDITILVANNSEYKLMAKALADLHIPCVYYSDRTSVLKNREFNFAKGAYSFILSPAVINMQYLMEAMLDHFNRDKIIRLLGSALLKHNAQSFVDSLDDKHVEEEMQLLHESLMIWERWGFLPSFLKWFKSPLHQGIAGFLSFKGGERELTDYMQIAEIVQKLHAEIQGASSQLQRFREMIEEENEASEMTQKRLESEMRQIKIYTIHKSKGLEFPLVFLPFIYGDERKITQSGPNVYYDDHNNLMAYSFEDVSSYLKEADDAEGVRRLYVALTRAVAANFLYLADDSFKSDNPRSLNKLLGSKKELLADMPKLSFAHQGKSYALYQNLNTKIIEKTPYTPKKEQLCLGAPSTLDKHIDFNFVISSFSDIVSGLYGYDKHQENGDADEESFALYDENCDEDKRFIFPKGAASGSFLHEMLEHCAFESVNSSDYRERYVKDCLNNDYRAVSSKWEIGSISDPNILMSLQIQNLSAWLYNICNASLKEAVNSQEPFSLSKLKANHYIPEMEFMLPIRSQQTYGDLNYLALENARFEKVNTENMRLAPDKEHTRLVGFIKGSIDLVFCHHERFYVVDYKSNFLGNHPYDYAPKAVRANVFSPVHRYDMQYLIYSVALQRFLRLRLGQAYSYAKHFGGVIYMYLRGLYADKNLGMHATRPNLDIIDKFEHLLCDEEQ